MIVYFVNNDYFCIRNVVNLSKHCFLQCDDTILM